MIGIVGLIYSDGAVAGSVEPFARDVKGEIVDAFGDFESLQFFAGIGVEDYQLAATAGGSSSAMATLTLPRVTGQFATILFCQRSITVTALLALLLT